MSIHIRFVDFVGGCRVAALVSSALALVACGSDGPSVEQTASSKEAVIASDTGVPTGMITISGTVTDPVDGPQAGITVTLSGSAQAQVVTNWSGSFTFTVKSGGSYSLTTAGSNNYFKPPFHSCLNVTPSIINLNNLTTSTHISFVGSGTDSVLNCSPSAGSGAGTGSLTIKGTVTSGGLPVAGARVSLNGSTQGYRITDEVGAYSFSVNPGSYSVSESGTCGSFSPSVTNFNNLKKSAILNITGTNCPPAPLTMCPALDVASGLSEPATCDKVSSAVCAGDRNFMWAGFFAYEFQASQSNVIASNDCRFGKWQQAPIVNDLTFVGVYDQQGTNLSLLALQLFGCALSGNLVGPLSLQGSLIPPDLIRAGLTFTTADLSALTDEYMASIELGLADMGAEALSDAQMANIRDQLDYAASKTPGVIRSSKLSYSTCP